jgi:5-methylcytosine-specific restriction endonuclease McrA
MMKRPCLSCGRLVDRGPRCPDCQRATYRQRARTRDPAIINLYGSAAWRSLADAVVAEAEACHWCGTSGAMTKLTADHIYPVRTHRDLALEPQNVVAACRGCQERRKRRPDPRTWAEWERRPLR